VVDFDAQNETLRRLPSAVAQTMASATMGQRAGLTHTPTQRHQPRFGGVALARCVAHAIDRGVYGYHMVKCGESRYEAGCAWDHADNWNIHPSWAHTGVGR
jgi:hypothetical protein